MTDESKQTVFCDTHCHLDMPAFSEDFDAVLQRASDASLAFVIIPALDCKTAKNALKLANQRPDFFYITVGIHPTYSTEVDPACLSQLAALAAQPGVVAIGELGLDFIGIMLPLTTKSCSSAAIGFGPRVQSALSDPQSRRRGRSRSDSTRLAHFPACRASPKSTTRSDAFLHRSAGIGAGVG